MEIRDNRHNCGLFCSRDSGKETRAIAEITNIQNKSECEPVGVFVLGIYNKNFKAKEFAYATRILAARWLNAGPRIHAYRFECHWRPADCCPHGNF